MQVRLDLDCIRKNANAVQELVDGDVVGVVKGVDARREVVDTLVDAGIDRIAVSRVAHLSRLSDVSADLVMLRIPAKSELPDVVSRADVTCHGSPAVVEAAHEEAKRRGVTHRVVPMIDAGAGREGVPIDDAGSFLELIERLDNLAITRVGVNLGCYHDVLDPEAVRRVARRLPTYPLSVGGSGMLLIRDELPDAVASYRVGDALLTGKYVDTPIDGLRRGCIELRGEVLASRSDEAVVDVGNVVSDPRHLVPGDDFTIERWTNELLVVSPSFPVGELVPFEMEYDAIATTFTSRYLPADPDRGRASSPGGDR